MLGVPANAGTAEIRRAYLASARRHHPDFHVGDDPAERAGHATRMQLVTEAWHVLGDPERRAEYDARLRHADARGVPDDRRRTRSDPTVPEGKGWTPRPGDDGWIDDFGAWADERDRLLPDDEEDSGRRNPAVVVPVGLFALAVLAGFFGLVFSSRQLLAASVGGVVISSVLFVVLPLLEMARSRRRPDGAPSATARRTPYSGSR